MNTAGKQVGGALPSLASRNQEERAEGGSAASHRESGTPKGKGDAGEEAPANSREAGETAGATAHDKLDTKVGCWIGSSSWRAYSCCWRILRHSTHKDLQCMC